MEKRASKQEVVDIPLGTLHRMTTWMERVYGDGNVVLIGGRAINLFCSISYRKTHDVDIVLPRRLTEHDIEMLPDKEHCLDEYFSYRGKIGDKARSKLQFVAQGMDRPIEIDMYYPFWATHGSFNRDGMSIGGVVPVPIEAVLGQSTTVKMGGFSFRVAKLEVLAVMKYNTMIERGIPQDDSRDKTDLTTIFRNHANNRHDFILMMSKIDRFLDCYMPEHRDSAISGILRAIDFNGINRDVGNEARLLLRDPSRLR